MDDLQSIFDARIAFDPAEDFEAFLKRVPAHGAVYLLGDAQERPVQLLCVMNLRYSLKRRLGGAEMVGSSRRVNYRDLVRCIYYNRVDSAFEADWRYYEAARRLFPRSYRGMVAFRPAWFVNVDANAPFPRYTKTIDLTASAGLLMGPFEDKHAAARFIQLTEDAFDLCRYHNILLESPHGKACAYKEMGKCPAPCDGSITLPQYRRMVEWSAAVAVDPAEHLRQTKARMNAAAAALNFESAQKIKAYAEQLSQFGAGPFRHVRRLGDFVYLSLQRGPRANTARVFLITTAGIEEIAGLICAPTHPADLLRLVFAMTSPSPAALGAAQGSRDSVAAERIGVVTHHLFAGKQSSGVFLRVDALDEKGVAKAFVDLQKQKQKDSSADEGLLKELQAL